MMIYKFIVDGANLSCAEYDKTSSGNAGVLSCEFNFTDDMGIDRWYCTFRKSGKVRNVKIENGKCDFSDDMLTREGKLFIGVFGTTLREEKEFKRISTNFVKIDVERGAFQEALGKVAPSLWEKYMILAMNNEADIRNLTAKCEDGLFDGAIDEEQVLNGFYDDGMSRCIFNGWESILVAKTVKEVTQQTVYCGDGSIYSRRITDWFDGRLPEFKRESARESDVVTLDARLRVAEQQMADIADLHQKTDAGVIVCSAEGEAIGISDSAELPLKSLRVLGKTEQVRTTGKNLFDSNKFIELIKSYDNAATEVVVEGRNCIKFDIFRLYKKDFSEVLKFDKKAQYTWSMDVKFAEKFKGKDDNYSCPLIFGFLYNGEDVTAANIASTAYGVPLANRRKLALNADYMDSFGKVSVTSSTVADFGGIAFSYNDRGYWYIDLDSIQIEEGNTVTLYEPYTGGKPSPSPEYPQELVDYSHNGGVSISFFGNNKSKSVELPLIKGLAGDGNVADEIDLITGVVTKRMKRVVVEELRNVGAIDIAADGRYLYKGTANFEGIDSDSGLCTIASYSEDAYGAGAAGIPSFSASGGQVSFFIAADSVEDFRSKVIGCELLLQSSDVEQFIDESVDVESFKNLTLFKPDTEFIPTGEPIDFRTEPAPMLKIEYIADTKTYIDNKFAELQTTILNNL